KSLLRALILFGIVGTADAFPYQSTRGPFYLQGTPLGYSHSASARGYCGGAGCGGWPSFRPEIEFGMHFSGRHDGIVLALRQAFLFTIGPDNVGGTTVLRAGYDLAIPIKQFEVTVAPYTAAGIGYGFGDGGSIGAQFGFFGVDGKFFFKNGLYGYLRPFELGMQCFHAPSTQCWFQYVFAAGVGFAFGGGQ